MAGKTLPGDIITQPSQVVYFNAPFDDKKNIPMQITNNGTRRIVWALKCTNLKRLSVDPPAGILDPNETVSLWIGCEPFNYQLENTEGDRITVEWTDAPPDAPKRFNREFFQGDVIIRRKNIQIAYNA
ncbi:unnamed protein product [Soboliphyme baturini]|uniref:Major sperm protein n=1 Tax=Soboliphyme baturini TaxID=241478 RepID=A0A183IET4_9BILA|nr:unnamed protein product [Soboliphyme baturini]